MRNRLAAVAALALMLAVAVPALAGEAVTDGRHFGAPVTVKKSTDVARLAKAPEKFNGRVLRIEGTVQNVCQGAGCWVEVSDGKGASFIARSLDESVLLPKDCKGQHVVLQGLLTTMPQEKPAEGSEKPHDCPAPTYVLSTQGVVLAPVKRPS